jgi:hypothetical protein
LRAKKISQQQLETSKKQHRQEKQSFLPERDFSNAHKLNMDLSQAKREKCLLDFANCPKNSFRQQNEDIPPAANDEPTTDPKQLTDEHLIFDYGWVLEMLAENENSLKPSTTPFSSPTPLYTNPDTPLPPALISVTSSPDTATARDFSSNGFSLLTPLLEEMYKLRRELVCFREDVANAFSSMDFKKIKKNRTLKNRCTFINRRNENCRGYICKVPGSKLCYAHHILSSSSSAASSQYLDKRKKLY